MSTQQRMHAIGGLGSALQLWLALLLICTAPAHSQQAALLVWQGVVRDARGAPVAGVVVQLTNHSTKAEAKTGAGGRFKLPPLPAGQYRLSIEAERRKIEYARPIDLAPGAPPVAIVVSGRDQLALSILKEPVSYTHLDVYKRQPIT